MGAGAAWTNTPHAARRRPASVARGKGDLTVNPTDLLRGICFKNGPPTRVGVELEWQLHDLRDPASVIGEERRTAAAADVTKLPLRSAVTHEPGGQMELSSPPLPSLTACLAAVRGDVALVRGALDHHGLGLAGHGLDPWHEPRRVLTARRYRAMETYFDRWGHHGRLMMCSTASVQVCVDSGEEVAGPGGRRHRWELAHLLGPVLVAAFANSPLRGGRPTGWKSTRQHIWANLDPGRSLAPPGREDPFTAWVTYVLDAPVLCVRSTEGPWHVPEGLTFRDWIEGHGPRPATESDLAYHLTTLFPPVRPRGHLELRMIDAQPGEGWIVPLALTCAVFDDPEVSERLHRVLAPLTGHLGQAGLPGTPARPRGSGNGAFGHPAHGDRAPRHPVWRSAARYGLAVPALREAAAACFTAALTVLSRTGADPVAQAAVADFMDRYVSRGRCPADDLLDSPTAKGAYA